MAISSDMYSRIYKAHQDIDGFVNRISAANHLSQRADYIENQLIARLYTEGHQAEDDAAAEPILARMILCGVVSDALSDAAKGLHDAKKNAAEGDTFYDETMRLLKEATAVYEQIDVERLSTDDAYAAEMAPLVHALDFLCYSVKSNGEVCEQVGYARSASKRQAEIMKAITTAKDDKAQLKVLLGAMNIPPKPIDKNELAWAANLNRIMATTDVK